MLTIEYAHDGRALADALLETELEEIIGILSEDQVDQRLRYSTSNIFWMIELYVAQGKIDYRNVQFEFEGEIMAIDPFGRPRPYEWPKGFLFDDVDIMEKAMEAGFVVHKSLSKDERRYWDSSNYRRLQERGEV